MSNDPPIAQSGPSRLQPVANRKPTDKLFTLLFPFHLFLWIQLGIYELSRNPISQSSNFALFKTVFHLNFSNLTIYGTVALFIVVLFLYILSKTNDEWMIFVTTCFIFFVIVGLNLLMLCQFVVFIDSRLNILLITFIITAVCLIYHIVIFMCTREINVHVLANMVKEPLKAIFHSPLAFLLSFVIIFWSITVLIITVTIFMITMPTADNPSMLSIARLSLWLRICTFVYGGTFVLKFIWNLGFAIVADYCANYYSTTTSNEKISRNYILQSVMRVVGYHMGTVAFMSMPILPSLCAIIVAFRENENINKQSAYTLITFTSKICLITDITDYVLIETIICGYESLKSMRKTINLHHSNPLLFLSLNSVFVKATEISILIALTIGIIVERAYSSYETNTHQLLIDAILATTYVILINKFFTRPAMCTWLIYQLTGFRKSNNRILAHMI